MDKRKEKIKSYLKCVVIFLVIFLVDDLITKYTGFTNPIEAVLAALLIYIKYGIKDEEDETQST